MFKNIINWMCCDKTDDYDTICRKFNQKQTELQKIIAQRNKEGRQINKIFNDWIIEDACNIIRKQSNKKICHKGFWRTIISNIIDFPWMLFMFVLGMLILLWMIGMPVLLYQEVQKKNCWVQERITMAEYEREKSEINSNEHMQAETYTETKGEESGEQLQLLRKLIVEKSYGVLIVILLFALIVYCTVLGMLTCFWSVSHACWLKKRQKRLLKEEYEPTLRRLMYFKKFRDQHGEEIAKALVKKLYLDE